MYEKAFLDFNKALEINPGYADAYCNRGVSYYQKGLYDDAIADYNKSLEINQKYADAYFNKAIVYEKKRYIKDAIKAYKSFVKYAPPNLAQQVKDVKQRIRVLEGVK